MSEQNYWTRTRKRRISRRTMLSASAKAGVGAAGLALVGCGDDDDDDDSSTAAVEEDQAEEQAEQAEEQAEAEEQAQAQAEEEQTAEETEEQSVAMRNGEVVQGDVSNSFAQLDPVTGSGGNDHQHLWVGHDNIVSYDKDLVPDASRSLAASWELADPEGLTIIFTQKPDVRFHDGTPVDAAAVKVSMDRARELEVGNTRADVQFVESIDVTDELTTTWNMSQPFAPLFRILGDRSGMLVSPKKIAESDDFLNREPTGAGAHTFVEEVDSDRLVFKANEDYWKPNAPLVNGVTWKLGVNSDQLVNALIAGDINIISNIDFAQKSTLEDSGLLVRTRVSNWTSRYWLNMRFEPWGNPHLRRALNWGVDKQALVDVTREGNATPAHWGWLGPATGPDHDPNFEGYVYNPDKVREELALGGFPDGFEYQMNTFNQPTSIAGDEFIQAQYAQFGIKANLDSKPSPAFWREFWDLEVGGHSSSMSVRADVWQQLAFVHDPLGQSINVLPEDDNDPDRVAIAALLSSVGAAFDPDERFEEIQKLNRAMDTAAWGVNFFHNWASNAHPEEMEFDIFADAKPHYGQDDIRINV